MLRKMPKRKKVKIDKPLPKPTNRAKNSFKKLKEDMSNMKRSKKSKILKLVYKIAKRRNSEESEASNASDTKQPKVKLWKPSLVRQFFEKNL